MLKVDLHIPRDHFDIDVQLQVAAGDIIAIFGPSGCGKTSLLRAIAGLEKQATGHVSMDNEIWLDDKQSMPTHKRDIGFVFQDARLFPHLNVIDNIRFGQKRQPRHKAVFPIDQAIELLALSPLLSRDTSTLSGGEKQRVAIARALATSPKILLFDEPLAAVDMLHKHEILHYIQSLHQQLNIPMLYVSHAIDEVARLSDNLLLMAKGKCLEQGNTLEMLSRINQPFLSIEDTATVIETRVDRHDDEYGLSYLAFSGGQFIIGQTSHPAGQSVRLRIMAKDVSLTSQKPTQTSILNVFSAVIESMQAESAAQVLIRLKLGEVFLLSRVTRKSAEDLLLSPGNTVFCQIKAVSLMS